MRRFLWNYAPLIVGLIAFAIALTPAFMTQYRQMRQDEKRVEVCESLGGIYQLYTCYTSDSTVIPARILHKKGKGE